MVEKNKYRNEVINYLDIHAQIDNNRIEKFSIEELQKAFPDMDEPLLKEIESEWRKARNVMINLKF